MLKENGTIPTQMDKFNSNSTINAIDISHLNATKSK